MKELMCFLWDNYLESHESEHIVLMGVGDSYSAVRELLVNRGKDSLFLLFVFVPWTPGYPVPFPPLPPQSHSVTLHKATY